ncbi:hypothetical protein [Catenulispora pinistramenti]|nr:hypothetical protein [Catenulispora pinistramenti]
MQGEAPVAYGQIYVLSAGGEDPQAWESMGGQRNGLCGAALPGTIFLITGLHTGRVAFTVELHDAEPAPGGEWEEIVEASFRPLGATYLSSWGGEPSWLLDLPDTGYRVRYNATGMDAAREADAELDDEPCVDRYLLQFWPAPPSPDRVVRQTSHAAAYWHENATSQPPPLTPEEKAEAQRLAAAKAGEAEERSWLAAETDFWGGRLPSESVRSLQGSARAAALLDCALAERLVEVGGEDQTRVARWIARRAIAEAGLGGIAWIADALRAADAGETLPPLFSDERAAWDQLWSDPEVPDTEVTTVDGRIDNFRQQAAALPTIFALDLEDPLRAVLEAFWAAAATFGQGRTGELADEIRHTFPEVFDPSRPIGRVGEA